MKNESKKGIGNLKNSYWVKSGIFTFSDKLIVALFGLLTFYIIIRVLSKEAFGGWVLFVSVSAVLESVRTAFVLNPMVKYLADAKKEDYTHIVSAAFFLNLFFSVIISLFFLFFSSWLSAIWDVPALENAFYLYVVITFLLTPLTHFNFLQNANLNFRGTFYSSLSRRAIFFTYVLVCFIIGYKFSLLELVAVQAISVFLSIFVAYYCARKWVAFNYKVKMTWVKELFHYGKYTVSTNVSSMIFKNTDSWMLGSMLSPLAVALYNPAIRVSSLVEIPTGALATIAFPQIAKRINKEGSKAAKYLYERSVGALFAIMLPIVLFIIVFSDYVVLFVAGEEYLDTSPILSVTMLYGLILPFERQFGITLNALGKPNYNFYIVGCKALLNVLFNYIFIIRYGVIGAAYGTLLTYIIGLFVSQIFLYKMLMVKPLNIFKYALNFYVSSYENSLYMLRKKTKQ